MEQKINQSILPFLTKHVVSNPIDDHRQTGLDDDIEVIDLDDPRGQIKPTTWHF